MARKLEEWQQEELTAFVNALADAAGYKKTADWARDSGYPASNLSKLRHEKMAVDGYNLFRLIRAASARRGQTAEDLATELARELTDVTKEWLDGRLRELSDLVTEALVLLRDEARRRTSGASRTGRRKKAQ